MKASTPIVSPFVFVVVPTHPDWAKRADALNSALAAKGFAAVGAPNLNSQGSGREVVFYSTYSLAPDDDFLSARNAILLGRFANLVRAHELTADILGRGLFFAEASAGNSVYVAPDRDLLLAHDEEFVADLSSNRVRSTIWLVRRSGSLVVRKALSSDYVSFADCEMAARTLLNDERVVPILERRGNVLYMPFVTGCAPVRPGLLSFCRRERASEVFDFLGHVNRLGYSMVDINPSSFMFEDGKLRVLDFEFFRPTRPASSFLDSADYTGNFDEFGSMRRPAKNGYRRYWYDAVGGPWQSVSRLSPAQYRLRLLAHILLYRVPMRITGAIAKFVRHLLAQAHRLRGLRWSFVRKGRYFRI